MGNQNGENESSPGKEHSSGRTVSVRCALRFELIKLIKKLPVTLIKKEIDLIRDERSKYLNRAVACLL